MYINLLNITEVTRRRTKHNTVDYSFYNIIKTAAKELTQEFPDVMAEAYRPQWRRNVASCFVIATFIPHCLVHDLFYVTRLLLYVTCLLFCVFFCSIYSRYEGGVGATGIKEASALQTHPPLLRVHTRFTDFLNPKVCPLLQQDSTALGGFKFFTRS